MQHEVDHRQIDKILACARVEFIILAQPTVSAQPCECPLDDPTMWQHLEADNLIAAPDNFQSPTGILLDPILQLARVAGIGPDQFQARTTVANLRDHLLRSVPILNAGRMNDHAHDQSQGIDDKMSFASFNLLASVVAALGPPFSPVFADWVSMIAALGVGSRFCSSRMRSWSLS